MKKYNLSWRRAQLAITDGSLTKEAHQSMVDSGFAEPSPRVAKLNSLPDQVRPEVAELLDDIDRLNQVLVDLDHEKRARVVFYLPKK